MAINKKKTSTGMKAVLIFVVVAFVASIIAPALLTGLGGGTTSGGTETGATLERIASTHAPSIASNTAALEVTPEDYNILVNLGNTYYDWGLQLMNELAPGSGQDLPMWNAATVFYERALAVEPGDPNVATDMAIAYFYGGNATRAVEVVEGVFEDTPDFAPAYFNSAIFYRTLGRTDDAVAALQRYLELEPQGASAEPARRMLEEMEGLAGVPGPETTPGSEEETVQP